MFALTSNTPYTQLPATWPRYHATPRANRAAARWHQQQRGDGGGGPWSCSPEGRLRGGCEWLRWNENVW